MLWPLMLMQYSAVKMSKYSYFLQGSYQHVYRKVHWYICFYFYADCASIDTLINV